MPISSCCYIASIVPASRRVTAYRLRNAVTQVARVRYATRRTHHEIVVGLNGYHI